jgi:Domain of unknown function (DUF1841)
MTLFNSYSREQLRRSYADAWAKRVAHAPLTPLEAVIADVIEAHPEYQALVADPQKAQEFEAAATSPAENPFLHMGLHLAIREQISIDRPPGVRDLQRQLLASHGDAHQAEHALMEALGETLWQAQRAGLAADETQYLNLARERLAAARGRSHKGNR